MRTTWSHSSPLSQVQNTSEQQKRNTRASTKYRETRSADDEHDLENLGRLRVLLPGAQVTNLERTGAARIDSEVENLMSRCSGHRSVECKRRLANLLDERASHRFRLPRIPSPRSRRQRYLQRIAAVERKHAPIVVLRDENHARIRPRSEKQRGQEQ